MWEDALTGMMNRIQQLESEIQTARSRAEISDAERGGRDSILRDLANTLSTARHQGSGLEPSGPRDWKPPTWDGKAGSFRDYLMRLRSSYRVRSAAKPVLSADYYWDATNDTLPSRERSRMRWFWEKGGTNGNKDPEDFFEQLEKVFADTNEVSKALERLTSLRHTQGQPWHEHQLEFDGLLLSAGGDSWAGPAKIQYLKTTFSNVARTYTASMPKTTDYHEFSEEVERIMTNLEETDQFKVANRKWRDKNKQSGYKTTVTTRAFRHAPSPRVDADGDTFMGPTQSAGSRPKGTGNQRRLSGKQRAKWVDANELKNRKEKNLCFRCGSSGHRARECPYAPPKRPTQINSVSSDPVLESDEEEADAANPESEKE